MPLNYRKSSSNNHLLPIFVKHSLILFMWFFPATVGVMSVILLCNWFEIMVLLWEIVPCKWCLHSCPSPSDIYNYSRFCLQKPFLWRPYCINLFPVWFSIIYMFPRKYKGELHITGIFYLYFMNSNLNSRS